MCSEFMLLSLDGSLKFTVVVPRPFDLWSPEHHKYILPLFFLLSVAWSLEMYVPPQSPHARCKLTAWKCDTFRRWLKIQLTISLSPLNPLLSELTFWLFLLHQGPGKRDWFHSWEFRTWYLGERIYIRSSYQRLANARS